MSQSLRPQQNQRPWQVLGTQVRNEMSKVHQLLSGGLTQHDHMKMYSKAVTTPGTPDTQFAVDLSSFGLSWTPTSWRLIANDSGGVVYESNKAGWTSTSATFKCTVASANVTIEFF